MPWRGRSNHVWPQIAAALDALRAENDVVVIEGAGSPAEINLHDSDIVNLRVARHCRRAACWSPTSTAAAPLPTSTAPGRCCPRTIGARIKGFVLNKFRGDPALLAPAPADAAGPDRRAHRGRAADVVAARPAGGRWRDSRPP
jgi:adenosylcobyric acid synthase